MKKVKKKILQIILHLEEERKTQLDNLLLEKGLDEDDLEFLLSELECSNDFIQRINWLFRNVDFEKFDNN